MSREGTHRAGRRWGRWLLGLPALVIIAVIAYGAIVALVMNPPSDGTTSVTTVAGPAASRSATPSPSASQEAATPAPPPVPVPPKCWAAQRSAEDETCQKTVIAATKYAPRYMSNQTSLAKAHPLVKIEPTGRGANSLARHGLLTCWMVTQPNWSLDDMQGAFYLWFHRHKFTVPNDDLDGAANNILGIAVQEVCPTLAPDFERKGGPKAELIRGLP